MKSKLIGFILLSTLIASVSCDKRQNAIDVINETIGSIDQIETIYYKQDMSRTNPRNTSETIERYREMYFERLSSDSIVGVKGHWYMYIDDKEQIVYEDIYDGQRLIRKNNRDSIARVYDLVKYPDFKEKPFWGHNTPYGMQYEFQYMLQNLDSYSIRRLKDTIIAQKDCFQIQVNLADKVTMPNFSIKLEDREGEVSKTIYFIDKETYYPIGMFGESYTRNNPEQTYFIDQKYYDIKFNLLIDEEIQFNTSRESYEGFEVKEMTPS